MCVPASVAATTGFLLEEILVTAQKREQDISTVPISISAFSGDQLEANKISKMEDLQLLTQGLVVEDAGLSGIATTITIRGVAQANFEDHNEGLIAVLRRPEFARHLRG
ncbi:MAG: iron complex outermembrane receptor protein [Bacteroidia bacterium]|jgi:iron complex outermembrane receptor protein